MSKLTLSISQSVIEEAKKYAKSSGKSLSSIVEEYLKSLSESQGSRGEKPKNKILAELRGSVKLPEEYRNASYKEILQEALLEKYLKDESNG
ncbi:MAG: DUF6364 family protein [Bacteroidota bacterium]